MMLWKAWWLLKHSHQSGHWAVVRGSRVYTLWGWPQIQMCTCTRACAVLFVGCLLFPSYRALFIWRPLLNAISGFLSYFIYLFIFFSPSSSLEVISPKEKQNPPTLFLSTTNLPPPANTRSLLRLEAVWVSDVSYDGYLVVNKATTWQHNWL